MFGSWGRAVSTLATALLLATPAAAGLVVAGPAVGPASASPALECGTVYSIQGTSPRNLRAVDTSTGTMTSVGTFDISNASGNLNGLGISADGEEVYGVLPDNSGTGRTVYRLTRATDQTQSVGSGVAGAVPTHGAINPLTGFYYYGGLSGSTLNIYGFNTTTNTSIGRVASGTIPNGGGNGDWAFDSQGRLYVIAGDSGNNVLSVIDQTIPSTSQTTPLAITASEIANIPAPGAINGMAFGGDGFLYLASGSTIFQANPSTGAITNSESLSESGSVDLASCAAPSTIELQKDFPSGRANPGDQATLSISGGGLPSDTTGTTTGDDPGVQSDPEETAGPVLGLTGTTYTISESGAGTGADYTASWECVNQDTGATIASGTGTSGQFTMPDGGANGVSALCTFTNEAIPDALDAGDAPDTFGTTTAANGPRHAIVDFDEGANSSSLMLGSSIDAEDDGLPGAAADGDDTSGTDDEDAIASTPVLDAGATSASLDVAVTNTTGASATLHGWIDADVDGSFQADEHATVSVANGATTASLGWTGLPVLRDGSEPVVRLRLSSGTLTDDAGTAGVDERARGEAPDGEVEDHVARAATSLPPGCATPFVEDFGAGTGYGPALPAGQTTYAYEGSAAVNDGEYALLSALPGTAGGWWHTGSDHTPNDTDGRMMVINASFQPGQFFQWTLTGLEVGSTYDFSAWITNANNAGSTILPNVTFRVVEPETGDVVAQVDTGSLPNVGSLIWKRFGMRFDATEQTLQLELVNNAPGGNGNDLAIDDISLNRACEFGDAPSSYGTLLADDGPLHVPSGPRLGATRDGEGDGIPGPGAAGDDSTDTDDEDGVADPIRMTAGDPTTVQVEATNDTGQPATLAGWLDLDGDGVFETGERVVVPVAAGTASYALDFPAGPDTTTRAYARFRIFTGDLSDPAPTGPADAGEVEDYRVQVLTRPLHVTKTSDATADTRAGDTVTYTVTLTNTGTGDFTEASPARVVDDLTGVLDDGTYNSDAAAVIDGSAVDNPAYTEPRLTWEGPLVAGETVTITYTVALTGDGDRVVRNVAWIPALGDPPGPTPDCDDPSTTVPCADVEYDLPSLSIAKTAEPAEVSWVGAEVTYTVVVTNEGPGDYTAGAPATFADDLSDVLDDATFVDGSITTTGGTASFTDPTLSWSGDLAAGGSATITYKVRYTGAGDRSLENAACVPAEEAQDPAEACDRVITPGARLTQTKTTDPTDGSAVDRGDEIDYTLSFTNDGSAPALVDTTDDLTDVLDDGDLIAGPTAQNGLSATPAGDALVITGWVPAGETRTVTYTVRVTAAGDGVLRNTLACQPGEPAACAPETTEHPVRELEINKTSNATADTRQGDTVTYTVTAENVGAGDYTADQPAVVLDDLTGVLDDAAYNGDATADVDDDPAYAAPRLRWEGALGSGQTVTITYTVTLGAGGDGVVRNVAWAPDPGDPAGPTPDCDDPDTTVPCADEEYELPRLTITKAADRTELPAVGQTVTYTVTVTNDGPGDYTGTAPASFADDLGDVLDDATFVDGSITTTSGTATFTDPALTWSHPLAAGDEATITYTVRYTGAGDRRLDNSACVPQPEALDPDAACATVSVPGSGLDQRKSSDPASGTSVDAGDSITYTLTFINSGPAPATVDTTDDLTGVLDDADLTAGPTADTGLNAIRNGDVIEITGTVPAGETLTVTYTVTVREYADQGDHVVRNALACQPGEPAGCEPETTEHPVRSIVLTKTSDATADSRPGDPVTYTVTARNRGEGDYTALDPAVVVDDLSGVLDDATYNGDATAAVGGAAASDPSYLEPRLAWTGALASGETVTITYTVTLGAGGDGEVLNVAWAPEPGDPPGPTPDCDDPATTVPCGEEQYLLPKLSIAKDADPDQVNAVGDVVQFTVTVTNDGPGDYTVAAPAMFADDLSDVLDDATFVAGSVAATRGDASFDSSTLSWTGVLTAGQSAEVTYELRYTGAGDRSLVNAACVPQQEAADPAERCANVTVPGSGLTQTKAADPESGTTVNAGDRVTYTLTFTNTGSASATIDTSDDLAGVLDDARLVEGPTARDGLAAVREGDLIRVTGSVPPGETRTVTYTVEVESYADQGDHVLRNTLACQPGEPADCEPETTEHPIRHLTVTKSSDADDGVDTGDTVTYTITVLNDGAAAYEPAVVRDDLSDVLDDATYGDASADRGAVSFDDPTLTWTGALAPGQTATITYEVTVTNQGDHDLGNIAWVPDCDEPGCNPPPVVTDLPYVVPSKSSDPETGESVQAGDVVTYTLSWTNQGKAAGVVDATDDLSGVLDDAEMVGDPEISAPAVTATRDGDSLRIAGPIDPGETVTVTYRVRIMPDGQRGDDAVDNVLVPDTPQVECDDNDECEPVDPPTVEHPIGVLDDWKTVRPSSGTTVTAGEEMSYTLHFTNAGTGSVDVDREDDLSDVLDDAKLVSGPTASNAALQVSGQGGDGRIRVTGALEPGQTVTVTYTVRVKKDGNRGDDRLANFLVDPGVEPPPHCNVAPRGNAKAPASDCTENPVSDIDVTKDVDLPKGSQAAAGDVLTYSLEFTNSGRGQGRVDHVDDLSDVLDDAEMASGPTSSRRVLDAEVKGDQLLITGNLQSGQTVTVTYAVRVKADGHRGDGRIVNYVFPRGGVSPNACEPDRDDCTVSGVSPAGGTPDPNGGTLPDTGSRFGPGLIAAALLCVVLGAGLVVAGRRRGKEDGGEPDAA